MANVITALTAYACQLEKPSDSFIGLTLIIYPYSFPIGLLFICFITRVFPLLYFLLLSILKPIAKAGIKGIRTLAIPVPTCIEPLIAHPVLLLPGLGVVIGVGVAVGVGVGVAVGVGVGVGETAGGIISIPTGILLFVLILVTVKLDRLTKETSGDAIIGSKLLPTRAKRPSGRTARTLTPKNPPLESDNKSATPAPERETFPGPFT